MWRREIPPPSNFPKGGTGYSDFSSIGAYFRAMDKFRLTPSIEEMADREEEVKELALAEFEQLKKKPTTTKRKLSFIDMLDDNMEYDACLDWEEDDAFDHAMYNIQVTWAPVIAWQRKNSKAAPKKAATEKKTAKKSTEKTAKKSTEKTAAAGKKKATAGAAATTKKPKAKKATGKKPGRQAKEIGLDWVFD